MDLIAEVKRKNNQLTALHIQLQKNFRERISVPYFSSYSITFMTAPFIIGFIAHRVTTPMGALSVPVCRLLLMLLRQQPIFHVVP